jgi:hypothetical protein
MPLPAESVPAMLPDASGFTELAVPMAWAFAAVEPIVNITNSGSAEMKTRPDVPLLVHMALLHD